MELNLKDPWLIAVWPGMGSVATGAGKFLVEQLVAKRLFNMPASDHFDLERVEVKNGIVPPGRIPRSTFYVWRNPAPGGHDLLIFVGEAQPADRGYEFCGKLVERALSFGVSRVFTFAAMATPMHPSKAPRVFAVATRAALLVEVQAVPGASILKEGEISGMNGVLLAAAADRDLEGVCLLGELPFFAMGVENPKASAAVLRVFGHLAGIEIDFSPLDERAKAVEIKMLQLLDKMSQAAQSQRPATEGEEGFTPPAFDADSGDDTESDAEGGDQSTEVGALKARDRRHVDRLFDEARRDRTKAVELKQELDRLGVFKDFEDRFLDLFRSGE